MYITKIARSIEGMVGWIITTVTRIGKSGGFRNGISSIRSWFITTVIWSVNAVGGIASAVSRFFKSSRFRNSISRIGSWVISAVRWIVSLVIWIISLVYRFVTSGEIRKGVKSAGSLLGRIRPRGGQSQIALAGGALLAIMLVLWIAEPDIPDFTDFAAGAEREEAFFSYFLPLIEQRNQEIRKTRLELMEWGQNRESIGWWDGRQIRKIAAYYRIKNFAIDSDAYWQTLLHRVDVIPPSLALAQAANESAWGTSRFARLAHNYYGQWCFEKGCGLVPNRRDTNKNHEVAAFDSPQESVLMYIHNLNSNSAYESLRDIRSQLNAANKPVTGLALAAGLGRYSERGADYISELRSMIKFNKLTRYDTIESG